MKKLLIGAIIGLVAGLAVGYGIAAISQAKPAVAAQKVATEPTIAQLLALVNKERAKYHIAPLKEDPRLDASAQMKANDEVAYGYFGHISPHDGKQGYLYINGTGIYCKTDSENLRENGTINSAQAAVNGWISSPPHHKAMIDPKYSLTGFGINDNEIVEHFCQQ